MRPYSTSPWPTRTWNWFTPPPVSRNWTCRTERKTWAVAQALRGLVNVGRDCGRPQVRAGLVYGGLELGELQLGDAAQGVLEGLTGKAQSGTSDVHGALRTGETAISVPGIPLMRAA